MIYGERYIGDICYAIACLAVLNF